MDQMIIRIIGISLISLLLLSAVLYFFHYIPDDTFITLRYARNAVRGYGLVFNRGDKLEGYSNFLWLMILITAGKIGLPLISSSRALSFLLTLGAIALTGVASNSTSLPSMNGFKKTLLVAFPPIALSATAPIGTWSLSGTEIPFFTAILLGAYISYVRERRLAALSLAALLGLVRPEGLVFFALFWLFAVAESNDRLKEVLSGAAILLAFYLPYALWKKSYFGSLLPNTFYAKRGPAGIMIGNGIKYTLEYLIGYGYLFIIGAAIIGRRLKEHKPLRLAFYIVIVHWATIISVGGDWMPHFRLLLPTLPFVLITASYALTQGIPDEAPRGKVKHVLAALLLTVLAAAPGTMNYDFFRTERVTVEAFANLGQSLREILPPNTVIACGSTGAIGYFTDLPILDILGLTDQHIAREGKVVSHQPGHMKTDGMYILNRKPSLLLLGNIQIHKGRMPESKLRIKIQEKEITDIPEFKKMYSYTEIPIGYGFYLSCYKRRDFFLPTDSPK